jgi:hypothetical protein
MLGPLLNDSADRRTAGRDLGAIAVSCWDLAGKHSKISNSLIFIVSQDAAES